MSHNLVCTNISLLFNCRFNILLTGTCRNNRKGWPKNILKMEKQVQRGTYQIAICHEYNLVAIQWKDSRVVNHLSSYLQLGVGNVRRRTGQETISVPCPKTIIHYQENVGGVDRADQMRAHFGGFAAMGHFKKWYKKTLLAVLDMMLHNARLMWNMSVESDYGRANGRKHLERYKFMHAVAHELLHYKTESLVSPPRRVIEDRVIENVIGAPTVAGTNVGTMLQEAASTSCTKKVQPNSCSRCVVCQLELSLMRTAIAKVEKTTRVLKAKRLELINSVSEGSRKGLSTCTCCKGDKGGLTAHSDPSVMVKKRIHTQAKSVAWRFYTLRLAAICGNGNELELPRSDFHAQ